MKIVVLTGSPRKKGTSALLADAFIDGASQRGHEITRFDCAFLKVGGCRGCQYCLAHEGQCVQQDDMAQIREAILAADLVVMVSPLYYFGISSQLKAVVDRFYAFNSQLMELKKDAALMVTCADEEPATIDAVAAHFDTICQYLGWKNLGMIFGLGLAERADAEQSEYPEKARQFGLSL